MAKGHENLQPVKTKEEARERGRLGGIASGISKRRAKTMKETLLLLLDTEYKKGVTYRQAVNEGLLKGAIKGDPRNYKAVLETIGESLTTDGKTQGNGVLEELIGALNNVKESK